MRGCAGGAEGAMPAGREKGWALRAARPHQTRNVGTHAHANLGAEAKACRLLPARQKQDGRWLGRAVGIVTQV